VKLKVASIVLPFFFKSSHNLDNKSPLVISFKFLAMLSFEASLSGSKVASNLESKLNNLVMQLMCPSGLPTFIPLATPNLSEIQVLADKEKEPLPKKFKKKYDVSCKCKDIWAIQFPWVEMLKTNRGNINSVKCIVCLAIKGKKVILGLKLDTLEKDAKKTKVVQDMPHLGKKEMEFYVKKKCTHAKNEIIYSQQSHISIVEQVIWRGLKRERGRKR